MNKLRIALPKGRLFNSALSFIKNMGIGIDEPEKRKLLSKNGKYEMLIARAFDVPVYIEHGIDIVLQEVMLLKRGKAMFLSLFLYHSADAD